MESRNRPTIRQDAQSWSHGRQDGRNGRQWHPGASDGLSYASGYVEGKAERETCNKDEVERWSATKNCFVK